MDETTTDELLSTLKELVSTALQKAQSMTSFKSRWNVISSKLNRILPCVTDLSKSSLCREQINAFVSTVEEIIHVSETTSVGKLHMQSRLDALSAKLEDSLRDCEHLVKTGLVHVDPTDVRDVLARLQIGQVDARHRAARCLLEMFIEDEKKVVLALSRTDVSAIVQMLATSETAATLISALVESGSCESLLLSEGVLSPLIRLTESGSPIAREKAVISLQRLSLCPDTARSIVGHGGIPPLADICRIGDSVSQSAAAGTLKNLSAVPEIRQSLHEEGVISLMISLLDTGTVLGAKEYAAEFLQNMTSSNEYLRRNVVSENGLVVLLKYLDGPLPQEPAVAAVRNMITTVPTDATFLLPCLKHVLKNGSDGAKNAAATIVCKISVSNSTKKLMGEHGVVSVLFNMIEEKAVTESVMQAIASLIGCAENVREVKRIENAVSRLVRLIELPAKCSAVMRKNAVLCLVALSKSKRCRKEMVSNGALVWLRKMEMMDLGVRKLIERLEKGNKFRGFFSKK